MSSAPTLLCSGLADEAASVCAGQRDAAQLLAALGDGVAPADLLAEALAQVLAHGDQARLRGWCRALQKQVERAAA